MARSSTPTRCRRARCRATATRRSPSPSSRSWTSWPTSSTWTRSSCGSRTTWAWAARSGARGLPCARSSAATGCPSCCATQPGEVIDFAGAMVKVNQDGSVDVITALMDHGGGTLEAFAKLVSEALCVPLDKVNLSPAGTRTTVYDVVTHATRGVYAGGGAVMKATQKVREDLLQTAARYLNVQPEALMIRMDEALSQGVVYAPA